MDQYGRRRADAKKKSVSAGALAPYSTYELLFEVVARIRESNGMELASTRQLLIVGRACMEQLSVRAMKKEGIV